MFHPRQSESTVLRTIIKLFIIILVLAACAEFAFPVTLSYIDPGYELFWSWQYYFQDLGEWMFGSNPIFSFWYYLMYLVPKLLPMVFILLGLILLLVNRKKIPHAELICSRRVITPLYLAFALFLVNFYTNVVNSYNIIFNTVNFGITDPSDIAFMVLWFFLGQPTPMLFLLSLYGILIVGKVNKFKT